MPFIFCSNCGTKINYELKKPDFCPKCKKQPSSALKSVAKVLAPTSNQRYFQLKTESDNVDYFDDENPALIAQIKASLLRGLNKNDIEVTDIPDFRVSIEKIVQKQDSSFQNE